MEVLCIFCLSEYKCSLVKLLCQFFLNMTMINVSGSGKDMGQAYVNFTRNCMDQIRSKVNDELWILNFFELSNQQLFCNKLHCNSSIKWHNTHPLTRLDSNFNTPGYDLLPLTHCLAD
uniref:Uncharacterized protein n=1 Tax=Timema monikensis TaxID=170555 RepID=A0A7R9ELM8_9NEOP|nr:unnamed protein product [Timema monikensis]